MSGRKYSWYALAILLFAILVREWFVLAAVYPDPMQGDVSSYFRYALHLIHDGTFSKANGGEAVVPDAYRGPGYPLLLAALAELVGGDSWYSAIQQTQVALGVATVWFAMTIARGWLGARWALATGLAMAFEPHHIAATGAVMTEVTFGFFLSAAILAAASALRRRSTALGMLSGAAFGYAYLVNPIIAVFPLLLLALFWHQHARTQGLALVAVSLLAVGGWGLRNHMQHIHSLDRGVQTFIYGSWPDYNLAWKFQRVDTDARNTVERANKEVAEFVDKPDEGVAAVYARMRGEPLRYLIWYVFRKPYLLWDWNIQVGAGGVNYLETQNSPLEKNSSLWAVSGTLKLANPILFGLAVLGALLALRTRYGFIVGTLFFYVTAIHTLFEADPRYSIPYKFAEMLLAANCVSHIDKLRMARKRGSKPTATTAAAET